MVILRTLCIPERCSGIMKSFDIPGTAFRDTRSMKSFDIPGTAFRDTRSTQAEKRRYYCSAQIDLKLFEAFGARMLCPE